jgi:hypothetical protein
MIQTNFATIADVYWYLSQEEREYPRLNLLTYQSRQQYPDALRLINVSKKKKLSYCVVSLRLSHKSIRNRTVIQCPDGSAFNAVGMNTDIQK